MLTGYSRGICAWHSREGIVCPRCAREEVSPLRLSLLEIGLREPAQDEPRPIIRYNLDTIQGERLWEQAAQARDEGDEERARELEESSEPYACDRCGEPIEH